MKNKKQKLVLIEWNDSILGFQGWKEINNNLESKITTFISVGFIVKEDEDKIILFPHIEDTFDHDIMGSGDITIPISAIVKKKYIKY